MHACMHTCALAHMHACTHARMHRPRSKLKACIKKRATIQSKPNYVLIEAFSGSGWSLLKFWLTPLQVLIGAVSGSDWSISSYDWICAIPHWSILFLETLALTHTNLSTYAPLACGGPWHIPTPTPSASFKTPKKLQKLYELRVVRWLRASVWVLIEAFQVVIEAFQVLIEAFSGYDWSLLRLWLKPFQVLIESFSGYD